MLETAAHALRGGRLVAFPTETFYALGAHALDAAAVGRVFQAKGRPGDKPLLVLVDSLAMVESVARAVPPRARRLMDRYWPGALTLVLAAHPSLPDCLTAGTGTIGVRLSSHPVARALVTALRAPVTAPSANPHGAASPRTADEVVASLGARVDLVLDGGPTPGGPASTLLDLTCTPTVVLRTGAIIPTREELEG